jgi:hypothetical protein
MFMKTTCQLENLTGDAGHARQNGICAKLPLVYSDRVVAAPIAQMDRAAVS